MPWDDIFRERKEAEETDEFIKEFFESHKSELKKAKVLDLGCGTGRHAIFLAENGLDVFAQDKSKLALNILKEKFKGKELKMELIESEIDDMPFPNQFFDAVISVMVLHHGKTGQIKKWVEEIIRVLKPKGFLVMSVLSANDNRYNTGKEIEPNTRINIGDTFDPEVPHHFFSKKEIISFLKGFSILQIEERERLSAKNYKKFKHWDVAARLTRS